MSISSIKLGDVFIGYSPLVSLDVVQDQVFVHSISITTHRSLELA